MFEKKVNSLLSSKTVKNSFVEEATKATHECLSANGSLKYSTSGDDFVDNFAAISTFKEPRSYNAVAVDMQRLWSQDPEKCLKLAVYIRLVTRKSVTPKLFKEEEPQVLSVQKGQGLKHEGIMRMLWIAINHPNTFANNIHLFIAAGSWKDIFTMLSLDLLYHGWNNRKLNWNFFKLVILSGIENPNTTHLVRKYLPTIRTDSKAKTLEAQADTIIGRWLARSIFESEDKKTSYKAYRVFKSQGIAHKWQQLISKQLYDQIEFDHIAGRALNLLVNSKFLSNHGLDDKYAEWIQSKPTAKYTGFVFELFKPLEPKSDFRGYHYTVIDEATEATINAQFNGLVELGGKGVTSRLLVARDISGSMTSKARGCNMSAYSIAKALALYFSEFLTGPFANHYIEFADDCRMVEWKGNTAVDKWVNDTNNNFGSTNFLSIAYLFTHLKERGVPESDFPEGVLCVSDGEFDGFDHETNFQKFRTILREAGFSEEYVNNFKLILWDIPDEYYGRGKTKFEEFADALNCFHMSGYDPSIISFLMDGTYNPCNSKELLEAVLNQDLLNMLTVVD